jgi:D-alanyl-D-alanine carboxypeptidase (penicillin-binding protein 5/6)
MSGRWWVLGVGAGVLIAATVVAAVLLWPGRGDTDTSATTAPASSVPDGATEGADAGLPAPLPELSASGPGGGAYAVDEVDAPLAVAPRLKQPPAAGILFDVESGEVLWARRPGLELPIASLTKMMTALIVSEGHGPNEPVTISAKAPRVEGSRIGVLKPGRQVPLRGLFLGLLLASGNDAAVALAEHDAGTVAAFVKKMNRRAAELGLACSRFAGPAGLQDTGNSSCAYDLAALARADLDDPWIASVTGRTSASIPFPVKGGRLELANNHYFAGHGIEGVPGAQVTGLKTGLTNGAGRCYVTTARLGPTHLGVVLLDSPDPIRQVPQLLRAGFAAAGAELPPLKAKDDRK